MPDWKIDKVKDELSLLTYSDYVVLDLETTGFSPAKGGRIIEIAAVRILNGEIVDTYQTYVDPQMKIPAKITNLTGIRNEDVQGQPVAAQALPELYKFIGDSIVVGHNLSFDWDRFLLEGFKTAGIFPSNDTFCTMKFLKKVLPGRGRGGYTLDVMCDILNVPLENHHQALEDTISTAKAFIKLIDIFRLHATKEKSPLKRPQNQTKHTPVNIKQVRYWEKRKNSREVFRRQYVRISNGTHFGTVFFDIPTNSWSNKDFPLPLDFEVIELEVLAFLGLEEKEDLINFRN